MTKAEQLLKKIAEFPLRKDFEYDSRGRIKNGSSSYSEGYAAFAIQELAKGYFK